jgi:DNA-binding LacI/PurR family transcriptional regulator
MIKDLTMAITIHDVAREAGTTISTVSKALNNSYAISGETTIRIKEIADRLGYRPNVRAQRLARRTNNEVVFLTKLTRDIAFTNPHMFEMMVGVEAALASKGYSLKIQGCDEDNVCVLAKEIMDRKQADGLLVHGFVATRELTVLLTRLEIPHIVVGKPVFSSSVCWVDNNNQLSGELAAAHLLELGHRKIAYIGAPEEDKISQARLDGIINRMKEFDPKLEPISVHRGESTVEVGVSLATELIKKLKPDAIVCANNILAYGTLRALQKNGIVVPDDISLVTFDDYPLTKITSPNLTTINLDMYELGLSAGKLLLSKIKSPDLQVQSYTTVPRLIKRDST